MFTTVYVAKTYRIPKGAATWTVFPTKEEAAAHIWQKREEGYAGQIDPRTLHTDDAQQLFAHQQESRNTTN